MDGGFILIASDTETFNGATAPSFDVANLRLNHKYWPLHERTRNRKIMKPGDKVLIYCGGQKRNGKTVIATAKITKIYRKNNRDELPEENEFVTGNAYEIISLDDISMFPSPIKFRDVLPSLSICPANMGKWGVILHGGARRISGSDFSIIMSAG